LPKSPELTSNAYQPHGPFVRLLGALGLGCEFVHLARCETTWITTSFTLCQETRLSNGEELRIRCFDVTAPRGRVADKRSSAGLNDLGNRRKVPQVLGTSQKGIEFETEFPQLRNRCRSKCYDPASSLCKRNDVQGKGWLDFSSLNLTNGLAQADTEDNVSGTRTGGSKG
jgi:hypothetical protein